MASHISSQTKDGRALTNEDFPPGDIYYLQTFPTELLIKIYCQLGSFSTVYRLGATCRRLQSVWAENTNIIYKSIAPLEIRCHRHARNLLADQGGSAPDAPVSVWDVQRLTRNVCNVNRTMKVFDDEVACHVSKHSISPDPVTWGRRTRPQHLTDTERRRFIRAYYQMWGVLILELEKQNDRMDSISLKDLAVMVDLTEPWSWIRPNVKIGDESILERDPEERNSLHERLHLVLMEV
ncbi:hypothetical protein P170DRAFT_479489 [Aspergillus steynii IBT 23096]|uniref:F-box domain-containing protein n=1 Tax=Aspergillus steynii IBT 23096 TaxID=1392250 RepID=A0A2I2FWD7_9EURO|nr:uncharacterized protein P170DRAFT_479489 [Aspergillus steynii IBT 23096]PLB44950.1 hypothetical protein P170DRAFT_479489 [Aspergillus steynii IBT 23096]